MKQINLFGTTQTNSFCMLMGTRCGETGGFVLEVWDGANAGKLGYRLDLALRMESRHGLMNVPWSWSRVGSTAGLRATALGATWAPGSGSTFHRPS